MTRLQTIVCALGLAGGLLHDPLIAGEVAIGDRMLRVADGYDVELITDPSLVERPIAVARDERGRLYVTDSGGMTERAEQQLEKKPHRIRRLADTDGDGDYDRSTLFADRMMFPEGCMWYDGSLYVAAPPEIWKLTDDNDDGIADRREVWFDGKTLTGCGNDLHGPYLGPDGRFYWCKGAFAEQRHTMADGSELVTNASHIFRAKPDGSEMESVLTGGMDNPVNVAFLENGERFLSCTFFQHPEAGRRDGLIHAIYGGVYGKEHDCILPHPRTGSVMPVLNHQGAAAPCGLIAGSRSLFGGGFDQHLFACYFNLHKVVMHRLIPDGPTYTTEDFDLLACDHPDFHPTDVFEDADGSLLIVDTGGWYKVCCPTSQLAKPDVLGAIYRVRKIGQPVVEDPLGLALDWSAANPTTLCEWLSDPRRSVSQRAGAALRTRGTAAVAALLLAFEQSDSAELRTRIVWTLAGIDDSTARAIVRRALVDADATTRQAAIHATGLWRDRESVPALLNVLKAAPGTGAQRAAAESLGRIGDPLAIRGIMTALSRQESGPHDASGAPADAARRIAEHALIYALIEINHPALTRNAWQLEDSLTASRGALIALDQMREGDLQATEVIAHMSWAGHHMRATAAWIAQQHPEWGEPLAEHFRSRVARFNPLDTEDADFDRGILAALAASPEMQSLLTEWLNDSRRPDLRLHALAVMRESRLSAVPEAWLSAIASRLTDTVSHEAAAAERAALVHTAHVLPRPKDNHPQLSAALRQLAELAGIEAGLRLRALDAAGDKSGIGDETFRMLGTMLSPELPLEQRSIASELLARVALTPNQREQLIAMLPKVGAMELPKLLPAFETHLTKTTGTALVAALLKADGFRGLRADQIKAVFKDAPPAVQLASEELVRMLNASIEEQTAMLEKLLAELPDGDVVRGHEVFMSRKAACNTCHKLGYGGGTLGPDLTNLGRVRNRRDIVEALAFPSSSMVRGYEPVIAELDDGRVVGGIITSESATSVTISTDAQKTTIIDRDSIVDLTPSSVSPMPNGLITLLTQQELADLVAFLMAER